MKRLLKWLSPEWVVVVEGQRGRGQRWKGPTEGHVRRSVELLLRRGGRGVRPFQVRRANALTEGLKYDRKPCNITSPRTFRPLNDDERAGLEPSNDALPLRPSGQVREEDGFFTKPSFEAEMWVEDVGRGLLPGARITLGPSTLHIERLLQRLDHNTALTLQATLMFYGCRRRWSWLELGEAIGVGVPELRRLANQPISLESPRYC